MDNKHVVLENHRVWKETEGSKYGNSHANSYKNVLKAKVVPSFSCIKLPLKVNVEDIDHSIFHKVFVGFMENTGMSYNMQELSRKVISQSMLLLLVLTCICLKTKSKGK